MHVIVVSFYIYHLLYQLKYLQLKLRQIFSRKNSKLRKFLMLILITSSYNSLIQLLQNVTTEITINTSFFCSPNTSEKLGEFRLYYASTSKLHLIQRLLAFQLTFTACFVLPKILIIMNNKFFISYKGTYSLYKKLHSKQKK